MTQNIPRLYVSPTPQYWDTRADPAAWVWADVPTLPPFMLANGSGPASQQTMTRVCYDTQGLYVRYDCADRDIWSTYTRRDEPIYEEEVVELFLAPGEKTPLHYFEFEVSPAGVLLDAKVYNPTSQRTELDVNMSWNCPNIRWQAERNDAANHWWAIIVIPWAAVAPPGQLPPVWRVNFYRIERPHDAAPEFSCWSPTMTEPADFHKPAHFGVLELR